MAMAELAGLPVVYGLYGTFLPLAVYGLLGTSRQHVVGPDSTIAALTAVAVAPMAMVGGEVDPARYAALAAALALAMGLLLFLAGALRLGFVADFFGKPVLLGYINGVALIVISSQLGKLLGISVESDNFFAILREVLSRARRRQRADRPAQRGAACGSNRHSARPSRHSAVSGGARACTRDRGAGRPGGSWDRRCRRGRRRTTILGLPEVGVSDFVDLLLPASAWRSSPSRISSRLFAPSRRSTATTSTQTVS